MSHFGIKKKVEKCDFFIYFIFFRVCRLGLVAICFYQPILNWIKSINQLTPVTWREGDIHPQVWGSTTTMIASCSWLNHPYLKFSEISAALGNSATIINLPNNYWGNSPTPIHPRTHFTKSRPPSKFHWYKKKTFRFPKFATDFRLLTIVSSAHIRQKTIGRYRISACRVEYSLGGAISK